MITAYQALTAARTRLNVFRELSIRVGQVGSMNLKQPEIWEAEDQAALEQIDQVLAGLVGLQERIPFSCEPLNLSTIPSARTTTRRCACGELLTMEMECDAGECCDCMADAAKTKERIPA